MVGRPTLYGLSTAGSAGVTGVLRLLRDELENGLALLGRSRFEAVDRGALDPGR
jgi:4-hydroxymandelate oxidase